MAPSIGIPQNEVTISSTPVLAQEQQRQSVEVEMGETEALKVSMKLNQMVKGFQPFNVFFLLSNTLAFLRFWLDDWNG